MSFLQLFVMFLQLVALMVTASALFIGIGTNDPTTQLSIMAMGMCLFWGAQMVRQRLGDK